jgi:hypothetical protein
VFVFTTSCTKNLPLPRVMQVICVCRVNVFRHVRNGRGPLSTRGRHCSLLQWLAFQCPPSTHRRCKFSAGATFIISCADTPSGRRHASREGQSGNSRRRFGKCSKINEVRIFCTWPESNEQSVGSFSFRPHTYCVFPLESASCRLFNRRHRVGSEYHK